MAEKMYRYPGQYCEAWNFGPEEGSMKSVSEVTNLLILKWGEGSWQNQSENNDHHETGILKLDFSKARSSLNWKPIWNIEKTLQNTINWYKIYKEKDMYQFCEEQIKSHMRNT